MLSIVDSLNIRPGSLGRKNIYAVQPKESLTDFYSKFKKLGHSNVSYYQIIRPAIINPIPFPLLPSINTSFNVNQEYNFFSHYFLCQKHFPRILTKRKNAFLFLQQGEMGK